VLGELNDLLRERGYVLLDEALGRLGFPIPDDSEGEYEGWVYNPHPDFGDGYISFGIWDNGFSEGMDWLNGKVDVIKLKFNVDRVPLAISLQMRKERDSK
jgi:hypothetical protein